MGTPRSNPYIGPTNRFHQLDNLFDHSAYAVFAPFTQRELDRRSATRHSIRQSSVQMSERECVSVQVNEYRVNE